MNIRTCKEFKEHFKELSEINILGTKYKLKQFDDNKKDITLDRSALGMADTWDKIIYIDLDWYLQAEENGAGSLNRMYKTIRHEIVHAFLYELGMDTEWLNERLADGLSIKATQLINIWTPFLDIDVSEV